MMKAIIRLLLVATGIWSFFILSAQTGTSLFGTIQEEDQEAIEALVLYPEATRNDILEATLHPELLIRIRAIQQETGQQFQDLITPYPKEVQQMLWDLTRYPDLIRRMTMLERNDNKGLNQVLENYPEVIYQRAKDAFSNYYSVLKRIDDIEQASNAAFANLLKGYAPRTQEAYKALLKLPEVLTILSDHIDLVVIAGDLYRKDPALIRHKADSLNLVVAQQQARDLADWKASLESNTNIDEDLAAVGEEFAGEYGYDDEYYDYRGDDLYYDEAVNEPVVIREYYYYNYPYWFGYPTWYVYPRWRPYPLWWDWGFYFGPGRQIIVINLPSYYFVNWYFYYPHHHYYHPYLTDHFIRYYEYHPRPVNSITTAVHTWRDHNRAVITDTWMNNERNRVEQIQEFGKFEFERRKYNDANPDKNLSQYEFYEKNTRRYPNTKATPVPETQQPRIRTTPQPKEDKAVKTPPRKTEIGKPLPPPAQREPAKIEPRKQNERLEAIKRAEELHKQRWEKQPPKPTTTQPRTLKRTEIKKTTPPKKTETPRKKNQ